MWHRFAFVITVLFILKFKPSETCMCEDALNTANECNKFLTYVKGQVNYNSTKTSNLTANSELQKAVISGTVCNFKIWNKQDVNNSFLFSIQFVRSSSDANDVFVSKVVANLEANFDKTSTIEKIYGKSSNATRFSIFVDVDECLSSLDNCVEDFKCLNNERSFECKYKYCKAEDLQQLPNNAIRERIISADSAEKNQNLFPWGSQIITTCKDNYQLEIHGEDKNEENEQKFQGFVITCDATVWTNNEKTVECIISTEFKVALIASTVSVIIILFVSTAFCVSWCNRRSKKKNTDMEEEFVFDYRNWDEIQRE